MTYFYKIIPSSNSSMILLVQRKQATGMKYCTTILGLLIFISTQANAQADINDFLSRQVSGNRVFVEYNHTAMLDSIDSLNDSIAVLNIASTELTDSINTLADSIVTLNLEISDAGFTSLTNENIHAAVDLWEADVISAYAEYGHIAFWNTSAVTDMQDLFKNHSLEYIFTGHLHINLETQFNKTKIIVTSALGVPLGNDPSGYRIIDFKNKKLSYDFYKI